MPLEALTEDAHLRIATIAEAMVKQFGKDAVRVAERQFASASGDIADRWDAIMRFLQSRADSEPSEQD